MVIPGTISTQIVPYIMGNFINEIGYQIKAPNGTIVSERRPGGVFNSTTTLSIFCPLGNCNAPSIIKYYVTVTSSCSGWGKNSLAIRQNGLRILNLTLLNGTNNTIAFNASQYQTV